MIHPGMARWERPEELVERLASFGPGVENAVSSAMSNVQYEFLRVLTELGMEGADPDDIVAKVKQLERGVFALRLELGLPPAY